MVLLHRKRYHAQWEKGLNTLFCAEIDPLTVNKLIRAIVEYYNYHNVSLFNIMNNHPMQVAN